MKLLSLFQTNKLVFNQWFNYKELKRYNPWLRKNSLTLRKIKITLFTFQQMNNLKNDFERLSVNKNKIEILARENNLKNIDLVFLKIN